MSTPEFTGALADGSTYRVGAYALEIFSAAGELQEELDLQGLRDVGRDGHAVSLRFQNGSTRVFNGATIDDAGRLQEGLRRHVRATPAARPPVSPPATTQSVQVSGSRSSSAGAIIGIAVLLLVIVLICFVFWVAVVSTDVSDDDPTPTPAATEAPAAPTEEAPAEPTTPETNDNAPTEPASGQTDAPGPYSEATANPTAMVGAG